MPVVDRSRTSADLEDDTPYVVGPADASDLPELVRAVLLDNADAIVIVDAGAIIVAANPAAADLFGRPLEALVGAPFGHPIPSGTRSQVELVVPGGEGRHVEMHVGHTSWRGEDAHVVTLRNVGEQHRAEQAMRDYVSMTAHEIASPLTSIAGFADTIASSWDELPAERLRHFAEIIARQAKRVAGISGDLLALSRLDAGASSHDPSAVDLRRCAEEVVDEVLGDEASAATIEVDAGLTAWCDGDHLATILRNYLSNALKYGQRPYRITAVPDRSRVEVAVHNAGEPISAEFAPHLFSRFAREERASDGPREGTGLGLALTRALATLNRGEVGHRDGDPDGAVFWVSLPQGRRVPARGSAADGGA